jgi:hypothetical protein
MRTAGRMASPRRICNTSTKAAGNHDHHQRQLEATQRVT